MKTKRLWLRTLGLTFIGALVAAACSGTGFSGGGGGDEGATAGEGGQGTSGTAGMGAIAGTGGGGTVLCTDASECDDQKPCTLDICNEVGVCEHPDKCTGDTPACCGGVCGQCCAPEECMDASDCTDDDCFGGFCSHTPTPCLNPDLQYCSETGCKDREQCSVDGDCADPSPCTIDTCQNGLCLHEPCGDNLHCCADGCAACCSDSQCAAPGDNVCNPGVCNDGVCGHEELCQGTGQVCCKRADGTADCGMGCCTDANCPNILCTRKLCTPTGCRNDPIAGDCAPDEHCVVGMGCMPTPNCTTAADCHEAAPCEEARCTNGRCDYQEACRNGTVCCQGVGCRECCSNTDCQLGSDNGTPLCCPDGTCGACCQASDCGITTAAKIITPTSPTIGGGSCTTFSCDPVTHQCSAGTIMTCRDGLICCPGLGCVSPTQCNAASQ